MATLDRLIPVCCATHFTYILEKLASEQALTLGLLAGLFWNHASWQISGKFKKTNNHNQRSPAILEKAVSLQTQIPMSLETTLLQNEHPFDSCNLYKHS